MKEDKFSISESLKIVGKALNISIKTKSKLSIAVSIFGFVMAFFPVIISSTLRKFTDEIQMMSTSKGKSISLALTIFILLAVLYIIQTTFNSLQSYTLENDSVRTKKYISETVLRCTCDVKYKYIDNYDDFKEKITFADSEAGYKVAYSMQKIIILFQNFITFISIFYALMRVNTWIVMILLVTCIPSIILSYKQSDDTYRHNAKHMKEGNLVLHYFFVCSQEACMAEIRHLGIFKYLKHRWREISDTYIEKKNAMTKKHVLYNCISDFLRNIVYIGVLLIVAYKIYLKPSIGLGTFMLVFTLSGQLQDVTSGLFTGIAQFASDVHYMKDFFILQKFELEKIENAAVPVDEGTIQFENVNFTYPNSTNKVLKNINVKIRSGEKIAIVGENGSGKSTFVSLICGMYEPDSGEVKVNDIMVKDNLTAVRRSISAVFQDFGQYEATVRENITISDRKRNLSDYDLLELTKKTNTFEVVNSEPGMLDEEIGLFSKSGNNLSGGQWQKIAITRAAYRNKAKIMILDEPTSALDPIAEAQLYSDFTSLTEDKTTILISHRLGITSVVDRILVFKDGEIIEDGSHEELIKNNGYYSKMYNAQAKWYR